MSSQPRTHQNKAKRRGRPRPLPPDVNARNLALEKGRREDMKKDLLELARLVPALAPVRRLSKTIIVKEGLQHFKKQRAMCLSAAEDMRDLIAENHRLHAELNELRFLTGDRNATPPLEPKPLSEAMIELMNVPNEICGTFPAGFGDNWACESQSRDVLSSQSNDAVIDHTAYCTAANDIPLGVEPLARDLVLEDHEYAASSIPLAQYPLPTEMLSQTSLNGSISPHTPVDLLHTLSPEGTIPDMTQLEGYVPFGIHQYQPVSLDTMPVDISTTWWIQGTGISESTLYGNTGTVCGT